MDKKLKAKLNRRSYNDNKSSEPGIIEENENEMRKVLQELDFIKDFKVAFSSEEGKRVLKWILGLASLLDDRHIGNSEIHYKAGMRHVIEQIIIKTIQAECELHISEFDRNADTNTITNLNNRLMILQAEIDKEKKGGIS